MTKNTIENKPRHVLIIPDGNRRWARSRGMKPWEGHWKGAERIEELTKKALNLGVKNLTFWGSSQDNLTKRPLAETKALLEIYESYFKRLIQAKEIVEHQVRIELVGRWREQFPKRLKKILDEGIEKTKNHSQNFLNFLLAYSGEDDILEGVRKIVADAKKKVGFEVDRETLAGAILSANLPTVDLIIRTGTEGDPHNSAGVLMWQAQNSQYYFSEKMFPEFGAEEFEAAILDFSARERRKGK